MFVCIFNFIAPVYLHTYIFAHFLYCHTITASYTYAQCANYTAAFGGAHLYWGGGLTQNTSIITSLYAYLPYVSTCKHISHPTLNPRIKSDCG